MAARGHESDWLPAWWPTGAVPRVMDCYAPPDTWDAERVLTAMRDWAALTGSPPRQIDWMRSYAGPGGSRERSLWVQRYPRWPSATTVCKYHGSWRAALIAAGLRVDRPPLELGLDERVEVAIGMRASGAGVREIAYELGVSDKTVRNYLNASVCGCGEHFVVTCARCRRCTQADRAVALPWTRELVLRAIPEWARAQGRRPGFEDWQQGRRSRGRWLSDYPRWPSASVVTRLFGSWNAAIDAAGFQPRVGSFTDEEVIAALRADAAVRGRAPLASEWEHRPRTVPGVGAVAHHFGSWTDGLRRAGLEPHYDRLRWARKRDVLDALRRLESELGRRPTSHDLVHPPPGYPNTAVITRRLGSWARAARELGWEVRVTRQCSDEQMIVALQIASCELGADFGVNQYKAISGRRGWPSANAIAARFGSWNAACGEAGLEIRPLHRGWSAVQLTAALEKFTAEIGRVPTAREWNAVAREGGWPRSSTVTRRLAGGSNNWTCVTDLMTASAHEGGSARAVRRAAP